MSQLSFLDNAREGKNNWWMYLITFIAVFLVMMLGTILPVEILNKFNNNLLNSIVGLGVFCTILNFIVLTGQISTSQKVNINYKH